MSIQAVSTSASTQPPTYEKKLRFLLKLRYKATYIPEALVKMRTGGHAQRQPPKPPPRQLRRLPQACEVPMKSGGN